MLDITTFDARAGGNVLYKALAHPLAAEAIDRLYARLTGPVALYDPDGIGAALLALYPDLPGLSGLFAHDVQEVGGTRAGLTIRALTELPGSGAATVLIAAFDAGRLAARIRAMLPAGTTVLTLDEARLPEALLTNRSRYLDRMNFATNFAFFRDADGLSTRLVSANYWSGYGAGPVRLWLRLYDADGAVLATWDQALPPSGGGFSIDSRAVRTRFGLPAFCGQLCLHAVGAAGHDVVKYALDTYASDNGASLSCTHDANAWPSDRYAGLPAPRADERCCGCRTATPRRSRLAASSWTAWGRSVPSPSPKPCPASPAWRWTWPICCPACTGRHRSKSAPAGTSSARAMKSSATTASASRTSMSSGPI
jgi:hypothetical protein